MDAVEHAESIVFLYRVQDGPANQSYGLQVAALAGVPNAVIQRARNRLRELEESARAHSERVANQLSLFPIETPNPALDALRRLDPDTLSPREALEMLYRLKELAD
jgi:DNA mismatch repair protein MutS